LKKLPKILKDNMEKAVAIVKEEIVNDALLSKL
jgi:hypothetical protein